MTITCLHNKACAAVVTKYTPDTLFPIQIFRYNYAVRLNYKMEPLHGRKVHQSQPDTSHNSKKCARCFKNHQRISIQHFCSTTFRVCFNSLVPMERLVTYLEDALEKVQRRAAQYVCNKYG